MKVVAKKGVSYGGKFRKKGSVFLMKDSHAKLFTLLGKVSEYVEPEKPTPRRRRSTSNRAMKAETTPFTEVETLTEEEDTKEESDSSDHKPASTRRYRRRDMTAKD